MESNVKIIENGDIFLSRMQTLVNTVNCVGVMGNGIALGFRKHFPAMYQDYLNRCSHHELVLGKPYLYVSTIPPWILNFPTKGHWRDVSRIKDIESGLQYLLAHYKEWGIKSLALPPLGCGQGQLEWSIVGPTLYRYLYKMDIPVELYAPYGTQHKELQPEFLDKIRNTTQQISVYPEPQRIRPAWVALVEILRRIENEPYHWPVGRTTFQKIAYVATTEGLPTNLEFKRGSYGPFASALKKVEAALVNNGLIEEQQLGNMHSVRVGKTFADARTAYLKYLDQWEDAINKVADLFLRVNTQQAELVATVLFATRELTSKEGPKVNELSILQSIMTWKRRRRPHFQEREVASTIRNLAALNWLDVSPSFEPPFVDELVA